MNGREAGAITHGFLREGMLKESSVKRETLKLSGSGMCRRTQGNVKACVWPVHRRKSKCNMGIRKRLEIKGEHLFGFEERNRTDGLNVTKISFFRSKANITSELREGSYRRANPLSRLQISRNESSEVQTPQCV